MQEGCNFKHKYLATLKHVQVIVLIVLVSCSVDAENSRAATSPTFWTRGLAFLGLAGTHGLL